MILLIAFRNIFRQKRRTILTMLSMVGGFTLASFAIGFQDGTYDNIIDAFTRSNMGHIQVHKGDYTDKPSIYKTIENYEDLMSELSKNEDIENMTPRVLVSGLASHGEKTSGVQIIGYDPKLENEATGFDKQVKEGKPIDEAKMDVLLGMKLAEIIKAGVGDSVIIISQAADGSMANDIFHVNGILDSGEEGRDRISFYIHIDDAQRMFALPGQVHEIAIMLEEIGPERELAKELNKEYVDEELNFEPWQVIAAVFYRSMQADRQGGYVSYFMILTIVAVGVLNTVLMTVLERTKEYGVLKALGTRPGEIVRLVLLEVSIMSVFSIIIGSIISYFLISWLAARGIDLGTSMDVGGITMSRFYAKLLPRAFTWPGAMVLVMSLLAGIFPAVHAARVQPAKALRNLQ